MRIEIAIIVNSFNRLPLLKSCLSALSVWLPNSEFKGRCAAIVYDAGSTDGSIEWLIERDVELGLPLEVIVSKSGNDTSFAAGLNAGVDFAVKKFLTLKYLLFYETDNQILEAKPISNAITQLEDTIRLAACGFTIRKHNGEPAGVGQPFPSLINFALGKNFVHRFQLEAISYKWQTSQEGVEFSLVDVVYTSPLLVRVEAWKESGGFDASLFPFSDCDVDWARRLYMLGWKMGIIRSEAVVHDNLDTLSTWSKYRAIQNHRGRLRYFKRHRPVAIIAVWPMVLLLRHLLEYISVRLFIKEPIRRNQLSRQFSTLLKSSLKSYE